MLLNRKATQITSVNVSTNSLVVVVVEALVEDSLLATGFETKSTISVPSVAEVLRIEEKNSEVLNKILLAENTDSAKKE
uniref:Uncharacterized protein n=1 Tax=Romanomermis culicivorax TaxID=13658 RepID=A0A915ISC4_ROMCU